MKKIIAAVLITLSLLLSFCGYSMTAFTEYSAYLNFSSYQTAAGKVSVSDITDIEINWVTGSVRIEESDTDEVSFSEVSSLDTEKDSLGEATENKEVSESLKMRYKVDGGKLTIQFCKSALRIRTGAVKDLKKDLTVYVPKGTKFSEIKTDVVSSGVYIGYVHTEKFTLNSISADMKLSGCEADAIKCDTVSGNLTVTTDEALQNMDFKSVSGALTVNARSVINLKADTVSANVELCLREFDFALTLSGISAEFEANGISYEKTGETNYKFNDGTGSVNFKSVSGKVRLEEK